MQRHYFNNHINTMTDAEHIAQEREQEAINDLDDAKDRIGRLEEDLRTMTELAIAYKEANTRLEAELRECLAQLDAQGLTHEH